VKPLLGDGHHMCRFYCPVKLRAVPTLKGLLGEGSRRKAAILLVEPIMAGPCSRRQKHGLV